LSNLLFFIGLLCRLTIYYANKNY